MNITLDKNSFVITGDEDRYNLFVKIFNKYNIPIPMKFDACRSFNDRGVCGCTMSHYTIFKIAQTYDLPYIIVFEDDAFPRHDIIEYFNSAMKTVPKNWLFLKIEDVFFNSYKNKKYFSDHWFAALTPVRGTGSAAYIMRNEAYKFIIDTIEKSGFNPKHPIDYLFNFTFMYKWRGYYISKVPMFLQHNLHNKPSMHNSNFGNNKKIVLGDPNDMKNFKIESWL